MQLRVAHSFIAHGRDLTDPALYRDALPPEATTAPQFMQLEDTAVWTRGWVCTGTRHAIARPGDLLPYTVGNQGIHVEHTVDGQLVGRFNKAPHGGCRFVPLQCQTGRKTKCTFTSCGHSRDRPVLRVEDEVAAHQYLGLRPERLVQVPVMTMGPLIFVNLGEDAPPLSAELAIHERFEDVPAGAELWREYGLNWKDLICGLAGNVLVKLYEDGLTAQMVLAGSHVEFRYIFPNLLLLIGEESACAAVVQPTGLAQTMLRVTAFGKSTNWHKVVAERLPENIVADTPVATFLCQSLARKIALLRAVDQENVSHGG